jgi:hypothetical protein
MDLLSSLLHEIGCLLGKEHEADGPMTDPLTAGRLGYGDRRRR